MKRFLPAVLGLLFLLPACSDDDTNTPPVIVPDVPRGLYILNEGTFQRSNASLSLYLPDSNLVFNGVFTAATGRALGDVGNALTIHDEKLWIVVNNSNRIEVLNLADRMPFATVECAEGASPRHIVFDDNGRGYISNLFRNSVSVYDAATNALTAEIAVGANPEGLAVSQGRLFVANSGFGSGNTVSVVDLTSQQVEATLTVGDNPSAVLALNDAAVAVLCTGAYNDFNDPLDDTPGKLFIIDTQLRAVVDSLTLGGHPQRLARDVDGHLYTIDGGVTRIHLASKTVTDEFIPGFYYGLFVDTVDGRIYVSDPIDYVQAGKISAYDLSGSELFSFDVGVIPGAMASPQ